MVLSFFRNLTPRVLTAMLMTTILVPLVLNLNLKWTSVSSMNSLLAAFLVLPLSQSASIPLATFLRKTRVNPARLRIVADRLERP